LERKRGRGGGRERGRWGYRHKLGDIHKVGGTRFKI